MRHNDGTKIKSKGPMIPRIIYLEPEMWDVCDRIGKTRGVTRSTVIRCAVKKVHYLPKIENIDWQEKLPDMVK